MAHQPRPPRRAVAALLVATLLWCWAPTAPYDPSVSDVADRVAAAPAAGRRVTPGHPWRPDLLPFGLAAGAVAGWIVSLLGGTSLVGRWRRRVGDVGDGWRALLLGAPPRFV